MRETITLIVIILILTGTALSQNFLSQSFYDNFERYEETSLTNKRFKHADLLPLIQKLKKNPLFNVEIAGESLEGRAIYLISVGKGKTKVLAWSQMHGDESTATMALFDIFNFLEANDEFNDFRKSLLNEITLYFIPMLNPDGAERFKRRNMLQIDLNRDALRLQFPEARTLKAIRDSLKPEFGFNLHDQSTRYTAGKSYKTATLSFLAPAYNYEKTVNDVRANTMKLIVNLYDELSKFIPGHIGRYTDDFEPRAFGDNFVKWGTSSVLIESGGWKDDTEKQFIRKLNFVALLTAFQSIAGQYYADVPLENYNRIPENDKVLFNLLFRNLSIDYHGNKYLIDVGINREEKSLEDGEKIYYNSTIEDIGDLSVFYGEEEYDCEGMEVLPGKIYPEIFSSIDSLENIDFLALYREGYTSIRLIGEKLKEKFTPFPINIVQNQDKALHPIEVEKDANFVIKEKEKVRFAVINGFVFDLITKKKSVHNAVIFK